MPKKNGLGRDVNNSLETMDELTRVLEKFTGMPLKKGLESNKVDEKEIFTLLDKTSEHAFALINMVENLKSKVKGINLYRSSRFASNVINRFLKDQA